MPFKKQLSFFPLPLLLRQVACKARDAFRTQPDAPVFDLDLFKNVGGGELRLLALRSFVGVGAKRGDIDQSDDPVIGSCSRDDTSTVRMADENGWDADSSQGPFYRGDIAFGSVKASVVSGECISNAEVREDEGDNERSNNK